MSIQDISLLIGILIALVLVILIYVSLSSRWREEAEVDLEHQPFQYQISQQLSTLGLPETKREKAAHQLTKIIHREVSKEAQKVQTEMLKALETKEKEVTEIRHRYTAIERNYQKLGKQKAQTESVVRSIAKGVIVLDDHGKVVFLNPVAEKILGVKSQNLIGRQISNAGADRVISMVNEEGMEENGPEGKNSAIEELKENTAVIETVYGQTKGVISIRPDPDPQNKVEEYKNEFIANITHELRSPLICIQKAIEMLSEKSDPEEKQHLDIARRNAARLEKLVNDILDLSKLESGKMNLRYEFFTLASFIAEIKENFRAWIEDKQIDFQIHLPEEPVVFEADRYRLGQVLTNLISNALKFSPRKGKVSLDAQLIQESAPKPTLLKIGVRDSGPGIDESEQSHIFKKFAFVSTQPTEDEKSTGLGLSIAKEIVELHKGRIWVESRPAQGSYFAFSISVNRI